MSSTLVRLAFAGGMAAVAAGAGAVVYTSVSTPAPPQAAPASPTPAPTSPASATPTPASPAPTFDVVRVSGSGSAVLAGRAAPLATVSVRDNGAEIGQARADARGEWVFLPAAPLSPGARQLTLAAISPAGEARSEGEVLLVVPDRAAPAPSSPSAVPPSPAIPPAEPAIAVLTQPQGPSRLLTPPPPSGRVTLDVVDYDAQGQIRFTGAGPVSKPVRIYVDNAAVGDARTDAQGRWTLEPTGPVRPGVHALRVDQLGPGGQVVSRVELPFERAELPTLQPGRVVVQPGQNLWRLARAAYGAGIRYTVIYRANQDQIRDPRRIYPGQAFTIPGGA